MTKLRKLRNIPKQMQILLPTDEDGFLGRECPQSNCLGYFLIKPGTGLTGSNLPCICPYCGHKAGHNHFYTPDQLEYGKSVALQAVGDAVHKDLREFGKQLERQTRGGFIQLRVDYKHHRIPLRYYREKQLETSIVCTECTLQYKIYGVFAFCPDCGSHNSLQILRKNLDLVGKVLDFTALQTDKDFAEYLIADALENCVSAFDGFGRATCRTYSSIATDPNKVEKLSFQSLTKANKDVETLFNFRLQDGLAAHEWTDTVRSFQKRHLLAHSMGIVDQAYLNVTHDPDSVVGRKVKISDEEVRRLIAAIDSLGAFLLSSLHP